MLNIKKNIQKKFLKKNFLPSSTSTRRTTSIFHETTPDSFQLISTTSRSISQNFNLIGRTNAEKMRDMIQTTDHRLHTTDYRHDQYITALFFCRGGKNFRQSSGHF
jgi:hypothetical protein